MLEGMREELEGRNGFGYEYISLYAFSNNKSPLLLTNYKVIN